MGCGVDKYEIEAGIFEVLVDAVPISEVRLSVAAGSARAGGVNHLVAANSDLTAAEIELMSLERREQRLREALAAVDAEYDYTLRLCSTPSKACESLSIQRLRSRVCCGPCTTGATTSEPKYPLS